MAAGQIEVILEIPLLGHDLGVTEHEAVRVEEASEVDVGEDARHRGVAGALEAVQLDRRQRIPGRQLIDDEHRAAGLEHPVHLGEHELRPGDVVERPRRAHEVE